MQAAHPESFVVVMDPRMKRMRMSVEDKTPLSNIKTMEDLARAVRLYFEGRELIGEITFDQDEGIQETSSNILDVLSARKYFACDATIEKHAAQRLDPTQFDLDGYLDFNESGKPQFYPPEKVRNGNLCRHITTGPGGLLKGAKDIFKFLLPQYTPPKSVVCSKIRQIMDACGSMYDAQRMANMDVKELIDIGEKNQKGELLYDPIHYSPMHSTTTSLLQGDLSTYTGALEQQLCDIYPVCARLKTTYSLRISGAIALGKTEMERVIRNMNNEMSTLLSTEISGVPNIYHLLYKESQNMIEAMGITRRTKEAVLMQRMFFKLRPEKSVYTNFGYRMNGISSGCRNCLMLMDKQISLFLILYARHFAVTANRVGVSGLFIGIVFVAEFDFEFAFVGILILFL